MKALPLSVYKNELYAGCSNSGISERYNNVLLICEDGYVDIDINDIPENAVMVVKRFIGGKEYYHLEPMKQHSGVGYMSGGAFAYTSDSRFPFDYPLSIHDRCETQDEYDLNFE